MKLKLPITLVAVDCVTPLETLKSIRYTLRSVEFARVVLVTSPTLGPETFAEIVRAQHTGHFAVHESKQGGRLDYEDFLLRKLHTCFDTSHCLLMEWDSSVINPTAWNYDWLNYDYIGAPWVYPENMEPTYPETTAENCVGNGGFSLRSMGLCLTMNEIMPSKGKPSVAISDTYMCRTRRKELEENGIKFAPFEFAERFSCENKLYSGQFGFHGKETIALNGWDWGRR